MQQPTFNKPLSRQKQIETIRSMLTDDHRAVFVEPHTFVLWGLAGALWLMLNRRFFSSASFPVLWQRAVIEELSLVVLFAAIVAVDLRMTQKVRRQRDESYPFIQRQVGKLSLLLAGLGVAASFGAWFFSWIALVFVLWTGLVGIALFIHGLFSEQFLEWMGLAIFAAALTAMVLQVPVEGTRWLLIATLGVGLPSLALLLRPLTRWGLSMRLLGVLLWVGAICVVAFFAWQVSSG